MTPPRFDKIVDAAKRAGCAVTGPGTEAVLGLPMTSAIIHRRDDGSVFMVVSAWRGRVMVRHFDRLCSGDRGISQRLALYYLEHQR